MRSHIRGLYSQSQFAHFFSFPFPPPFSCRNLISQCHVFRHRCQQIEEEGREVQMWSSCWYNLPYCWCFKNSEKPPPTTMGCIKTIGFLMGFQPLPGNKYQLSTWSPHFWLPSIPPTISPFLWSCESPTGWLKLLHSTAAVPGPWEVT